MRDKLLKHIAPREEKVVIDGDTLTVREMGTAADAQAFRDKADMDLKFIVRCVFDAEGKPVFTDEDIPFLRSASRLKMLPIIEAVNRVMGFDVAEEVKNSDAAPSAG